MNRPDCSGLKILLVEDHRLILLAVSYILRSLGHFVTTSRGVAEALSVVETGSVDLMISDLQLSDCDGLELIDRVRVITGLPAIAISGRDELREICLFLGFSAFLAKPILSPDLHQAIRRVMSEDFRPRVILDNPDDLVSPIARLSRNTRQTGPTSAEELA